MVFCLFLRELFLLLLCVGIVLPAPQQDSNITYVTRQAKQDEPRPDAITSETESKIENVPLTIPGTIDTKSNTTTTENTKNITTKTPDKPIYNYSDRIYSIKTKPKTTTSTTEETPTPTEEVAEEVNVNKTDVIVLEIKDTDISPAESILQDTIANENQSSTYEDVTESDELVTEKYEEEATATTEVDVETTRPPLPKFIPKLSYFGKSSYPGSFSQNLIANPGKRRFRSRCRCEKIWNCVKLQISVPRCPEEYFLCCS